MLPASYPRPHLLSSLHWRRTGNPSEKLNRGLRQLRERGTVGTGGTQRRVQERDARTAETGRSPPAAGAHLVHADVAFVAEHHLVAVLPLRRAADIAHHVLVVLDAQTLLRFDGDVHVLVAHGLQLLQHSLQGDLVQLGLFCKAEGRGGH